MSDLGAMAGSATRRDVAAPRNDLRTSPDDHSQSWQCLSPKAQPKQPLLSDGRDECAHGEVPSKNTSQPHSSSTHPLLAEYYDPGFCRPGHAFIDMPTFAAVTYNIRTLSGMATDEKEKSRQKNIFRNIRRASHNADVIILQETKSPPAALYDEFQGEWEVFDNPTLVEGKIVHRAGTVMLVRRSFGSNFVITPEILDPGYLQVLQFEPRKYVNQGRPFFSKSFSLTNVYLHSTCHTTKLKQLQIFGDYQDPCAYSFAGGDWNTKLIESDSVSGSVDSGPIRKAFKESLARRRMLEVWHPAMTKISNHDPPPSLQTGQVVYLSHTG